MLELRYQLTKLRDRLEAALQGIEDAYYLAIPNREIGESPTYLTGDMEDLVFEERLEVADAATAMILEGRTGQCGPITIHTGAGAPEILYLEALCTESSR